MAEDVLKPDLCIIGAGSGGLTAAAAARAFGASVVLIERGEMGGDCLNTGCVPSKSLIAAAHRAAEGREGAAFGVAFEEPRVNFGRINEHINDVIASIAPHDSAERFEGLGATVIRAEAKFIDKRTVEVDGRKIRARRFIIAAGSRPSVPPIPGLADVPYFTNETIFTVTRKPAHLVIIGAGPIGMELAQAFRRLGSDVTVVDMADPLPKDDPELTHIALRRIRADGVVIRDNTSVRSIEQRGQQIAVITEKDGVEDAVTGSHLLIAAGRTPNTDSLNLQAAGVRFGKQGIKVNAALRSSNRRVYAVGDIAGGLQFTHVASYHASQVIRSTLFGLRAKAKPELVPWATYTDPEIANVGLTEAQARKRYGDKFKVLRWSYAENDRARAERRTDGVVKLILKPNGKILGCGIVGEQAGEMISLFSYAIANGGSAGNLVKFIAPYPTLNEMAKRIAVEHYKDALASPWIGRWLNFIRLLP